MDGASFYDTYCEGYADTSFEDSQINAGYAVWRECIAEIIARELDDSWGIPPLGTKKQMLAQLRQELVPIGGKLAMSQILVEVITSDEVERNRDWETAKKHIEKLRLFDMPTELPMIELVFKQLRGPFIQIDIDFISKVGSLYLETISLSLEKLLAERLRKN